MKIRIFEILGLFSMFLLCCCADQFSDASDAGRAKMLKVSILPQIPPHIENIPLLSVNLVNPTENYTVNATIKDGQLTELDDVMPGIYNVTLSGISEDGIFSGGIAGLRIFSDRGSENPLVLPVSVKEPEALCFKEIFYTSSPDFYKKDQYYEIYNNSDRVVYLDNLCITTLQPDQSAFESEFMTWNEPDADEYVYARVVFRIPGTGTDYPLEPGQSVVIASLAVNHKLLNTSPNARTVDLTSAEFEAWIPSMTGTVSDNPKSINMDLYVGTSNNIGDSWFTTVYGCCYALFRSPGPTEPSDFAIPIGRTQKLYRIRLDRCIDVVECVKNQETKQRKRVPNILDAGSFCMDAIYNNTSIVRKIDVKKTEDAGGRIVLQDTNNTTNDFEPQTPPMIRRYLNIPECIPSWSLQSPNYGK